MITAKDIKPIPKYMLNIIKRKDKMRYSVPCGNSRFYSYLAVWKGELTKITVAVRHKYNKWYCKQVAVHSLRSDTSYVKDLCFYQIAGYIVGWHDLGLYKTEKHFEDGIWYENQYPSMFDPYAPVVNIDFLNRFPEYKYCPYQQYHGTDILHFLRLYEEYPQMEYLYKSGLGNYATSVMILRQMKKDKSFHKWLVANKYFDLTSGRCYCDVILRAYKKHKPLKELQAFEERKRKLCSDYYYKRIKPIFKKGVQGEYKRFFDYIDKHDISYYTYQDYIQACIYLNLDIHDDKIRYPHDFKRWHDIRTEEESVLRQEEERKLKREQAQQLRKEKRQLVKDFMNAAKKYLPLDGFTEDEHYAVFIAKSPAELIKEGNSLSHCVGRGTYERRMANEESLIFFVRKMDDLETPFVTIEYSLKKKQVLQCYAYNNTKPDEKVLNFVNNKWLPHTNQQIQQIAA